MNNSEQVTYFAETNARGQRVKFGIKAKDRTRHVYVIGKTGTGKSTMIENMAIQDIHNGNGLCFMDPHGSAADKLLQYVPEERKKDVLYIAPFDMEHPVSFNIMEDVGYDKRNLVVSGLMSAFKKIWQDAWSARMEYILTNTLFALLEYPDSTLLSVNKMLSDKEFRKKVVDNISDTSIRAYWTQEFASYTDRFVAEAVPAIQNKVGQFTSNPLIRNIIGQPKSSFDFRQLMDDRKIVLVNLSKGRMGEANANLLGSLLITKIYLSAMSRADLSAKDLDKLPNFYFYVDEFQSFANESFADILSEARKYKLNLTIAHQYIEQMEEEVRNAVFGNVGTMITFRVGAYDAEYLEKEFAPTFTAEDIVNLGFAEIYLRLMIDGMGSKPFSARTVLPDIEPSNLEEEIIEASRKSFSSSRVEVEQKVKELVGISSEKIENKENHTNNNKKKKKKNSNNNNKLTVDSRQPTANNRMKEAFADIEFASKEPEKDQKPVEEEKLSLKELKKPRNTKTVSSENKNSLKEALAKALADKQKTENKEDSGSNSKESDNNNGGVKSADVDNSGHKNPASVEDSGVAKPTDANFVATEPTYVEDSGVAKEDRPPENPNEISEDKLKKMLEV
jgi:hypothetical protein